MEVFSIEDGTFNLAFWFRDSFNLNFHFTADISLVNGHTLEPLNVVALKRWTKTSCKSRLQTSKASPPYTSVLV